MMSCHRHVDQTIDTGTPEIGTASDVKKDCTCKDKDKDQAYKDQDKDKELNLVLKGSLRTRTRINITGNGRRAGWEWRRAARDVGLEVLNY